MDRVAKLRKNCTYIWIVYMVILGLFCIASSPVINTMSTDSEVFWLMGRGMVGGKVLYRDLFDHKGLYLYIFNAAGCMIQRLLGNIGGGGSNGLFIVELSFCILNCLFLLKIARIFLKDIKEQLIAAFLGVMFLYNYLSHQGGNLTETYTSTFQLISIFYVLIYYRGESDTHIKLGYPPQYMFIHGINVGCVFFLRANLVAMWIPIPFIICISMLLKRNYKNILCNVVAGLAGVAISFVPVILYGMYFQCLEDIYFGMIGFNFLYIEDNGVNIFSILSSSAGLIVFGAMYSMILCLKRKLFCIELKLMMISSFILSLYMMFKSGRTFGHYYQYFIPFLYPAILMAVHFIFKRLKFTEKSFSMVVMGIFCLTILSNGRLPIKLFLNERTSRQKEYSETVNQIISHIDISALEGQLLAIGNNVEFYNKLDYLPEVKYFYLPSINYELFPDAVRMQEDLILSKNCRYVVAPMNKDIIGRESILGLSNERIDEISKYLRSNYRQVIYIENKLNQDFALYEKR